jgi:sugar-specific transcriptional regulator TrmB
MPVIALEVKPLDDWHPDDFDFFTTDFSSKCLVDSGIDLSHGIPRCYGPKASFSDLFCYQDTIGIPPCQVILVVKICTLHAYKYKYYLNMSKNIGANERDELSKQMEALGLKQNEALVYLALLSLGEVGTSKISESSDLHSQLVYIALDTLEKKGLVQHVIKRGRKKFSAKHPQALVRLVAEQKHIAEILSTKLEKFSALPKEQRFEVFQGNESYVAHEFDLLREAPDGSEILIIEGVGGRFIQEMGNRMPEYEELRIKKRVGVRYIGSNEAQKELEQHVQHRKLFSYRFLPGLFTGQVGTDIWPSALGFNVYSDPVTSSVHYNEVIAGSYRQFFEVLWNLSSK